MDPVKGDLISSSSRRLHMLLFQQCSILIRSRSIFGNKLYWIFFIIFVELIKCRSNAIRRCIGIQENWFIVVYEKQLSTICHCILELVVNLFKFGGPLWLLPAIFRIPLDHLVEWGWHLGIVWNVVSVLRAQNKETFHFVVFFW